MNDFLLDALSLRGVFVAVILLILICVEIGYRFGKYRGSRSEHEKEAPVGAMVGATLGLLAFTLAFTFGMAASRYDARRQLVLDEANAIGTTYLRTRMLPDRRHEISGLLRTYVDIRLEAVASDNVANVTEAIRQSESLQEQMWTHAVALGENNPNSIVVGLFIQSLNDVIDLHSKRVTVGIRNRIPGPIWVALFAIAALSFAAMGYQNGLAQTSRSIVELAVALTFSALIVLIADLDRPQQGALRVSQQALIDLRQSMNVSGP